VIDAGLLERAKWCAIVELYYSDSDPNKITEVSWALLDMIDYGLDAGIIRPTDRMPAYLDSILFRVYTFMGDPLV
jgi:hypothetical protein